MDDYLSWNTLKYFRLIYRTRGILLFLFQGMWGVGFWFEVLFCLGFLFGVFFFLFFERKMRDEKQEVAIYPKWAFSLSLHGWVAVSLPFVNQDYFFHFLFFFFFSKNKSCYFPLLADNTNSDCQVGWQNRSHDGSVGRSRMCKEWYILNRSIRLWQQCTIVCMCIYVGKNLY